MRVHSDNHLEAVTTSNEDYAISDIDSTDRGHDSRDSDLHNLNHVNDSLEPLGVSSYTFDSQTRSNETKLISSVYRGFMGYLHGKNGSGNEEERVAKYYRYFYLPAYATLFLALIATLEILHYVSNRQHGLADASRDYHYLWTYAPSLVLTIIAAFWSQFEYRAKQMMPWAAMRDREMPAEKSLLLDYISSPVPKALVDALRAVHIPVVTGTLGTLVLRALIIASTGLLSLRNWTYPTQISLALRNEFNFTVVEMLYDGKGPLDPASIVWTVKDHNLSYPIGTSSTATAQTFSHPEQGESSPVYQGQMLTNKARDHTVYADMDVFTAELQSCESFEWRYSDPDRPYNSSELNPEIWLDVWTDNCFAKNFTFHWINYEQGLRPGSEIEKVECSNVTSDQNHSRILISISPTGFEDGNPESFSGIICDPVYSMGRRRVTSPAPSIYPDASLVISNETKQSLPISMSVADLNNELAWNFFYGWVIPTSARALSPWFSLLNQTLPQKEIADFRDANLLSEASRRVFPIAVSQWMNLAHLSPTSKNVSGTALRTRDRLFVVDLPLRLMESLFGLLVIACILTSIWWPIGAKKRDSGRLMTNAVVLSQSQHLKELLHGTGSFFMRELQGRLADFTFTVGKRLNEPYSHISVKSHPSSSDTKTEQNGKWWQPTASSLVFRTTLLIVLVIIVILLEVIFQVSEKKKGLATVDDNDSMRYAWIYGPTGIMTLVAIAFTTLSSAALALHPFQALRRGSCKVQVLMEDPADKLVLHASAKALFNRQFSLGLILAAALTSSMLTICASGLYTTRYIPRAEQTTLGSIDWFNITNISMADRESPEYQDGWNAGSVQYYNLSYPQWTYDGLAFPRLQNDDLITRNVSLSARIPAVRAQMNCSAQFHSDYVTALDPPPGCSPTLSNGTRAQLKVGPAFNSQVTSFKVQGYFATNAYETSEAPENRCPGSYRWWYLGNQPDTEGYSYDYRNVTILSCQPFMEYVLVNTTFKMPGYEIDKWNPPQPDESTARFLGNDSASSNPSIMPFNVVGYEDSFFQAVVWGFEGTPIEELVGEENVPRALEKAERTYRQIVAQNLNEYFRIPASTTSAGNSFDATTTDSSELRLVQNAVSTRLLEGILLFMAICAGVSFFLERSTRILPKNPASIASAMSLFADSNLLRTISQGLSMPDGEKRLRDEVLKESYFRLGWWDVGTARERFGIDIDRPGESHLQIDDQENSISLLNMRMDNFSG